MSKLRMFAKIRPKGGGGAMLHRIAAVSLILASPTLSWAQTLESRFSVTSIETLRSSAKATDPTNDSAAASSVKNPINIGDRETVQVRFQVGTDVDPKMLPREGQRLGLFLRRDRDAIASIQRGTLLECKGRFCLAAFAGNVEMQFFAEEVRNPDKWFVQVLQNPILEERLIESEEKNKGLFDFDSIRLGVEYGRQGITLDEKSSTLFNSAKSSKRMSYGAEYRATLILDNWEFLYANYSAVLDTTGFFSDLFVTKARDRDISLSYVLTLWKYLQVGASASLLSFDFTTTADDEVLLSTQYSAWSGGGLVRYILPFEMFRLGSGNYVFDVGQGTIAYKSAVFSSATDVSSFKRGDKGDWTHWRLDYQHSFILRSGRAWLNGTQLGLGMQYQNNKNLFTGEPSGPGTAFLDGTSATGSQFSWKFFIAREFVLK